LRHPVAVTFLVHIPPHPNTVNGTCTCISGVRDTLRIRGAMPVRSGVVIGGPKGRSPRAALVKGRQIERIVKKYVV